MKHVDRTSSLFKKHDIGEGEEQESVKIKYSIDNFKLLLMLQEHN